MKKGFKKLGAVLLTVAMALTMNLTVFAAGGDMNGESGVIGEFTSVDTPISPLPGTTLTFYKEITAYNPETCTVNAPTITYEYTIGAGDSGKTITDNASHHAQNGTDNVNVTVTTKAGVGTPTISGTAAGELAITTSDTLSASANGKVNRFALNVDFSGVDFTTVGSGAGVYRYVINETTTEATKNASGIKEGEVANTLYLDVYVDGTGAIYGYVLFTNNNNIDATTSDAAAATAAGKIEGFVGSQPASGEYSTTETSIADKYYTFNLDLTKVVVNDTYGASHQFPFTVTLANSSVTAAVKPEMTITGTATQTALSAAPIAGTWSPTIANGGKISYVGIPCGTTITVKENNDVVGVTYNSVSTNADTNADAKSINTGVDSNTATINCGATALTAATENHTSTGAGALTFTNTLLQISPTGFVVRFAPYMLVLMGGIFLIVLGVVLYKRTNKEEA